MPGIAFGNISGVNLRSSTSKIGMFLAALLFARPEPAIGFCQTTFRNGRRVLKSSAIDGHIWYSSASAFVVNRYCLSCEKGSWYPQVQTTFFESPMSCAHTRIPVCKVFYLKKPVPKRFAEFKNALLFTPYRSTKSDETVQAK